MWNPRRKRFASKQRVASQPDKMAHSLAQGLKARAEVVCWAESSSSPHKLERHRRAVLGLRPPVKTRVLRKHRFNLRNWKMHKPTWSRLRLGNSIQGLGYWKTGRYSLFPGNDRPTYRRCSGAVSGFISLEARILDHTSNLRRLGGAPTSSCHSQGSETDSISQSPA